MKSVSISGSLRENVGKKDAKAQRNQGMIPCVIYGGKDQKMFVVDERQFKGLLYSPEVRYAEVNIDNSVKVNELHIDNITFVENPNSIVAAVLSTRNVEAEQPAEEA